MGPAEITAFLAHLAVEQNAAASTQTQALSALLFLYQEVLLGALRLRIKLDQVRRLYDADPRTSVSMPMALARKFRSADKRREWQYVFPSRDLSADPRTRALPSDPNLPLLGGAGRNKFGV